jgi:hypothetical protein
MTCDWIARVEFHIIIKNKEGNHFKKYIIHDHQVTPVWKTNYCDDSCIQDEIDIWKQYSPDKCIYTNGQWNQTENDIVFSTAKWSGIKGCGKSHVYTKSQIVNLLEDLDFNTIVMITAKPIGDIHY